MYRKHFPPSGPYNLSFPIIFYGGSQNWGEGYVIDVAFVAENAEDTYFLYFGQL